MDTRKRSELKTIALDSELSVSLLNDRFVWITEPLVGFAKLKTAYLNCSSVGHLGDLAVCEYFSKADLEIKCRY